MTGVAALGALEADLFSAVAHILGVEEVLGERKIFANFLRNICLGLDGYQLCKVILFKVFGPDEAGLESEFIPTVVGHFPEGSSRKLFEHLVQIYNRDKFEKYDYGAVVNLEMYNCTEPPQFDLSKVTMKVCLIVGKQDYLSSVEDTDRLSGELPNVVHHQVLPFESFNHIDFIWGKNMRKKIYPYLLALIKNTAHCPVSHRLVTNENHYTKFPLDSTTTL